MARKKNINLSEMSFEEALSQVEDIVNSLDDENSSLDDALQKFSMGMKLSQLCFEKLEQAESMITGIIKEVDGKIKIDSFFNMEE